MRFFFLTFICAFSITSFAQPSVNSKKFKTVTVAFYNLENLFDTVDTEGVRDEEFTPEGSKNWNSVKYQKKLNNLSEVISQLGVYDEAPEILGVSEIENRKVLEDLVQMPKLKKYNYQIAHFNSPDRRGVDVALLYQPTAFEVTASQSKTLRLENDTSFRTRDLLFVSGKLDGEMFHFMVAHWPSRRGGEKRSRPLRIEAAKLARGVMDSLLAADPNSKAILMGDLNDDPTSPSVKTYMKAVGKKEKMTEGTLFNPMTSYYKKGIGTLAWRDSWNLFDQMILTPSLIENDFKSYQYYGTKIFNKPFIKQFEGSFKGYPYRTYVGNTFMGGYSDHFPVFIFLVKEMDS